MKVLHVVPALGARTGGPAVSVVESSLAVAGCGVVTTIAATDLPATASLRSSGSVSRSDLPAGAERLDVRLYRHRFPHRLAFSPQLYRALRREMADYDVVHIHSLWLFPQLAAHILADRHGIPVIVSPRGALDPWLRRRGGLRKALANALWQDDLLERAAFIHVTSAGEADLISDIAPATPRAIVPNGINWAQFASLPDRESFHRKWLDGRPGPVVLTLGRIAAKKGLDILVRAFGRAAASHPGATLVLAGPDDEGLTPRLRALAAREGIGERTVFTGMLRGNDKLAALAAADVWALPSHTENFAVAAAEALAAGRATILSTAINIAPEAAAKGATLLAEPTLEDFAACLMELLSDPVRRNELGIRAQEFARRYDWRAVAPQLAAVYAEAAKKGALRD